MGAKGRQKDGWNSCERWGRVDSPNVMINLNNLISNYYQI
jgi:hypothetical protein